MDVVPPPAVRLTHFSAGYRGKTVYEDVEVTLPQGTVALLGPNGAGKSTLMNAIAGLNRRTRGEMAIMGVDVSGSSGVRSRARIVGYLPQRPDFDPHMSVQQHVAYCGWLKGMSGAALIEATRETIEKVALTAESGQRMGRLSGGMLRRAAIAGTIVARPRLLVLDEPTAGLDPAQRAGFKSIVRSISEATSVLLATHLVEDVIDLCDTTAIVADGQFAYVGSTNALGAGNGQQTSAQRLESAYLAIAGGVER